MDFYKVIGFYEFNGRKKMSRKFGNLLEAEKWCRENTFVSIKVAGRMEHVPFDEYVITHVSEETIKLMKNG